MAADVHVDLDGHGDLAGSIYRQLRKRVLDGDLQPGERLPPSRELALRLGVSRTTVVNAYDRLVSEGFLDARVGSGTYVTEGMDRRDSRPESEIKPPSLQARAVWADIPVPFGAVPEPPRYDFRSGIPDVALFPLESWRRLMAQELQRRRVGQGAYGDPKGHPELRGAIARHLAVTRGVEAPAEGITVTNGTQQAVDVIARCLLNPGDVVAVEDPGYPPLTRLLRSLGAQVVGVPVDREGLCVEALPPDARVIIVTPSHQFPLGVIMSLRRRLDLLQWARRHGAAIVEDDYDSEFRFDGRPVQPLWSMDTHGHVIYVGTFSKTMLPMIRLGFLLAPPSILHAIRAAKFVADWHSPMPVQGALANFIGEGLFARHLRRMRRIYRQRHDLIVRHVKGDFAGLLTTAPSAAGLHVTALTDTVSVDELREATGRATRAGIAVQQVADCRVTQDPVAGLVLGYGIVDTTAIPEGLNVLRRNLHVA